MLALVGSTNAWDAPRQYDIPAGTLHVGTNVVAVKVLDWGGHSGMWTKDASALSIRGSWRYCRDMTIDGQNCLAMVREELDIPLAGEWKFKAFPAEPRPKDLSGSGAWDIAACHNGMVAPLFGMAAKGAIWYQGCSDVGNADLYARQFPAMVGSWHSRQRRRTMPQPPFSSRPLRSAPLADFGRTPQSPRNRYVPRFFVSFRSGFV